MRKMILATMSAFTLVLGTGCGNACDDLAQVCEKCGDPFQTSCEAVVRLDDGDACEMQQRLLGDSCELFTQD